MRFLLEERDFAREEVESLLLRLRDKRALVNGKLSVVDERVCQGIVLCPPGSSSSEKRTNVRDESPRASRTDAYCYAPSFPASLRPHRSLRPTLAHPRPRFRSRTALLPAVVSWGPAVRSPWRVPPHPPRSSRGLPSLMSSRIVCNGGGGTTGGGDRDGDFARLGLGRGGLAFPFAVCGTFRHDDVGRWGSFGTGICAIVVIRCDGRDLL